MNMHYIKDYDQTNQNVDEKEVSKEREKKKRKERR